MDINEIKQKLREFICRELLNNASYPIIDNQPLITGGLIDSFSLAQVGVFVEDTFNIYIPDTELTVSNMNTLEMMAMKVFERAG